MVRKTGVTLGKVSCDCAALSHDDWLGILVGGKPGNDESVVALTRLGKDNTLRISKRQWHRCFEKLPGLVCGSGAELNRGGNAGPVIYLGQETVKLLGVEEKSALCITKKGGEFFVKRFSCEKLATDAPGWLVIDEFRPADVTRWSSSRPELSAIRPELLERMISDSGTFRQDPMRAMASSPCEGALPQKKELLSTLSTDEEERLSRYVDEQQYSQFGNGSWGNGAVTTSGTVIRLLQSGVPKNAEPISRAIEWLEGSVEPFGMPGLFMYDEQEGREYNRRIRNREDVHMGSSRIHRNHKNKLAKQYFDVFQDLVPKGRACEPHTTWPTALALQALLRCDRSENTRVKQAIDTLLRWRCNGRGCGGWCGCGIYGSTLEGRGIDAGEPLDFDSVTLPGNNTDLQFATWFTGAASARHMICSSFAEDHQCVDIGPNLGLLVRNRLSPPDSNCTTVMQGALAWHPDYRGSAIETLAAYEMTCMQNPDGSWPSHRVSGMLHFLSLIDHPLAKYLAYRSLPLLISSQRDNGLWFSGDGHGTVDDILVLRALQRMGILERLLPRGRPKMTREAPDER